MFKNYQSDKYNYFLCYLTLAVLACVFAIVSITIISFWAYSHEDVYSLIFGVSLFVFSLVQVNDVMRSAPRMWNVIYFKGDEIISKKYLGRDETKVTVNKPVYYVTLWTNLAFENAKRIVLSNNPIDIEILLKNPKQFDRPNQVSIFINSTEKEFVPLEGWINQGTLY